MKCLIVLSAFLSATYALSCHSGADNTAAATECTGQETKCKGPAWTAYTGYADNVEWACGECGAAAGCADCTDDNCNAPVTIEEFGCYVWTYETDAWKQSEDPTTCKITGEEVTQCNAPDRNVAESADYTLMLDGCGPCDPAQKTAGNCLECDSDKCNGSAALSISFLLAALLAAFYTM